MPVTSYIRSELVFAALPLHTLTVKVIVAGASSTVDMDGGPYISAVGGTPTARRDDLLSLITAGTHPEWTAATQGTDEIFVVSTGPAQKVSGSVDWNPSVTATTSTDITLTENQVAFAPIFASLILQIKLLGLGAELVDRPLTDGLIWVGYAIPKTLQFTFEDALSVPDLVLLDALLAVFDNAAVSGTLTKLLQFSAQLGVGETLIEKNRVLATNGSPNGGAKILNIDEVLNPFYINKDAVGGTAGTSFAAFLDSSVLGDPPLEGGDYFVDFSYIINGTASGTVVESRVEADGVEIYTALNLAGIGDLELNHSGEKKITVAAGTRNFKIEVRRVLGPGSVEIRFAHIKVTRTGL